MPVVVRVPGHSGRLSPLTGVVVAIEVADAVELKARLDRGEELELLEAAGFTRVHNLRGGILAWARDVDPTLPTC